MSLHCSVHVCVLLCLYACVLCVRVCRYVYVTVRVFEGGCGLVGVWAYVCVCVYVHVCVCARAWVCTCACVRVFVYYAEECLETWVAYNGLQTNAC